MWDIYNQKCCTFNPHPTAKVNCLTQAYISSLLCFFSFSMKLKEYCTKNVCISSSVNIPRPLKSTHITIIAQPRLSYEGNKMNSMILFFIFPFVRYVCSVVQNHISASHVDYGNRTVVRKTSLPSKPYCC